MQVHNFTVQKSRGLIIDVRHVDFNCSESYSVTDATLAIAYATMKVALPTYTC